MRLWVVLGTLFVLAACPDAPTAASSNSCMNGLGPALVAEGFSGSVDCQRDRLIVRCIGKVRRFGRTYEIYSNKYALKPPCPECAIHGGQRIIFMERGRYVGQYRSDFVHVTMRHGQLLLLPSDPRFGRPTTVKFTRDGPPKQVLSDGEVVSLFR